MFLAVFSFFLGLREICFHLLLLPTYFEGGLTIAFISTIVLLSIGSRDSILLSKIDSLQRV